MLGADHSMADDLLSWKARRQLDFESTRRKESRRGGRNVGAGELALGKYSILEEILRDNRVSCMMQVQ